MQDAHHVIGASPTFPLRTMYYDDQGRRFNLLSGLLFGTLLGAGIALLAAPERRAPSARLLAPAKRLRKQASRRFGPMSAGMLDAIAESVADLRRKGVRRR